MSIEIVEEPIRIHLRGLGDTVHDEGYGEVGLRLMNALWKIVQQGAIPNKGQNHWVYLPDGDMFVGVEPHSAEQPMCQELESLDFELPRYLKHTHLGPYQTLPQKWQALRAEIAARGEAISAPALEIYGHHCADPAKLETTILISLQARPVRQVQP